VRRPKLGRFVARRIAAHEVLLRGALDFKRLWITVSCESTSVTRGTRGLHVHISNPDALMNLRYFLRRAGYVTAERRSHELEVDAPGALSASDARRELNICLASWQAQNPGVETYIIEDQVGAV
jgi:hypothetical protein